MASNKKAHILAVIKYIFSIIGNNNANIIINDSDISGSTIDRTKKGKYCYILQRYLTILSKKSPTSKVVR